MQQNNHQTQRLQTGRWSKEEHQRFMYAITQFGKDWKKVEAYVRTRSGSQVRSHAQKFFNKLQKVNQHHEGNHRSHQQFSQTEFDIQKQLNNEYTPSTPLQLVSLIKKHQKEQDGKINIGALKQKLDETHEKINDQADKNQMPLNLVRQNSYKSMSNILSAYEEIKQEKQDLNAEDQGFLILLTKKYKKYFGKMPNFDKLIDIHNSPIITHGEPVGRKRSFTLPEGSQLSGDELEQKIEQIKKQINTQGDRAKSKTQKQQKRQGKGSNKQLRQEIPGLLTRLDTIQQNLNEDELNNSFRAIPLLDVNQSCKEKQGTNQ